MILVDTSVWADHFRRRELVLTVLLAEDRVLIHPFVIGELALGDLRPWHDTVATLRELPQALVASDDDFLSMVAAERLVATGIGFVDAHLLASARQTPGARFWTRDKRLAKAAEAMSLGWSEPQA
jgi:hypothetical protein